MEKIEIKIPNGKKAEWVNGVLTLVDDKPMDIMDRVKTFEDACNELGEDNCFVRRYKALYEEICDDRDMVAYLKLRIVCAALNEGWVRIFQSRISRTSPFGRHFGAFTHSSVKNPTSR